MITKTYLRSLLRAVVLLFLTMLLFSCLQPGAGPREEFPEHRNRPRLNITELEKRIHALINKERKKHGLSALAWDGRLSNIARAHSRDMAKRNYFSHDSPEGWGFSERYKKAGFTCAVREGNRVYLGAENIFQNNLYDRVVITDGKKSFDWNTLEKIAQSTVQGWMNSPGHRKNILTPQLLSEGIGVAVSTDDKVYITQNFC